IARKTWPLEVLHPAVERDKDTSGCHCDPRHGPNSSNEATQGQPSQQYEHMGCFKLFSFERPSAAMLPSEADMTP
ncbi:unnamed protein product, partial [Scytosiphon promiscuus]